MTVFYFIIGLGLLVFIHEFGHFIMAKRAGIRVEQFSLGFGPKILGFRWGETEYKVSILPLGGYVKMSGEEPEEGKEPLDDPRSFASQSMAKRLSVVLAGPVMNLVLAFVLMPIVFMIGRMEPTYFQQEPVVLGVKKDSPAAAAGLVAGDKILAINGKKVKNWDELLQRIMISPNEEVALEVSHASSTIEQKHLKLSTTPDGRVGYLGVEPIYFIGSESVIDQVTPHSPAEKGGLKAKDKILAINSEPILNWDEMTEYVSASQSKPLDIEVERGGQKLHVQVTPEFSEVHKKWIMGITKDVPKGAYLKHRYDFVGAVEKGIQENVKLFKLTFEVLKKLFSFKLSYKALGGPLQIAQTTAQAAKAGLGDFFYFLAFLSMQLGIFNLLPIPVLDGGHVAFMFFEAIRRKPLSVKTRLIAQQIGMVMLLCLMVLATFNDIDSIWGFQKIWEKLSGIF